MIHKFIPVSDLIFRVQYQQRNENGKIRAKSATLKEASSVIKISEDRY